MSDGESDGEDRALARELERFCASDELSLEGLRERLAGVCFSDVENSSFFHRACLNEKVTLEVVEYILEYFPINAASMETDHFYDPQYLMARTAAYPLHCACANESCPDVVLKLLMEKGPVAALGRLSVVLTDPDDEYWGVYCGDYECEVSSGTPLHYYLARKSNVDIDMVKALANACPGALILADENSKHTCLHTLICNPNIRELYEVAVYIAERHPSALDSIVGYDEVALHIACSNCKADPKLVGYLLNVRPESIRSGNISGELPLHILCRNKELEEAVALEIYRLLIERDPSLPTVQDEDGMLPLHQAVCGTSLELIKLLVASSPESIRATPWGGRLPLHEACYDRCVDTVKYLVELWPESIGIRDGDGLLPLHEAAKWDNTRQKADIIEFLLSQDPAGAGRDTRSHDILHSNAGQSLPLHLACRSSTKGLRSFRILFDAYPEAITAVDEDGKTPIDLATDKADRCGGGPSIVRFLKVQRAYFRKAQKRGVMTTLDDKGWLPLHHALRDNATLGAVKLLLKGNPSAVHVPVGRLSFPLHIACQFSSVPVVKHLLELGDSSMTRRDFDNNTPLHYACRSGNCETALYLLERHDPSVSETNSDGKLPIHLLCEAGEVADNVNVISHVNRRRPAYVETVWRLLLAHPETLS